MTSPASAWTGCDPPSNGASGPNHLPLPSGDSERTAPPEGSPPPPRLSPPIRVFGVLRQGLADGSQTPDAIIRASGESARVLTGADGIAIALRSGGAIICRARSGDLAPELGAQLNAHSGFSGECLRTASILLCHDAANDERVDPEVCRMMGIRSIIAVPLRGIKGIAGILEGFAAHPDAFGEEQVNCLRELASIVEEAYEAERKVLEELILASQRPQRRIPVFARSRAAEEVVSERRVDVRPANNVAHVDPPEADESDSSGMRRYWVIGMAAAALLLVLGVWLSWRTPMAELPATQAAIAPEKTAETSLPKPSASRSALESSKQKAGRVEDRRTAGSVVKKAAEIQPTDSPTPDKTVAEAIGSAPDSSSAATGRRETEATVNESAPQPAAPSSSSTVGTDSPPSVTIKADEDAPLGGLAPGSGPLPITDAQVSQGITQGELIHKVDPVYPLQARAQRLGGSVELEITIAENGKVRSVKELSGEPVLATAASNAIRQWRYKPLLLNGKPITAERHVTVVFRLPNDAGK